MYQQKLNFSFQEQFQFSLPPKSLGSLINVFFLTFRKSLKYI